MGPASGNRLTSAERDQQKVMVAELRKRLDRAGIPHRANDSHIVPVMVGDATKCKWISDWLPGKAGIYVQPINYPPVPPQLLRAWLPSRADRFLKVDLAENLSQSLPSDF